MDTRKYYPRTALFLLTALNLLNYMDRYILPAVQTQIQDEFHVSSEKIGLVTTAFIWCYVLAAPLVGPLADRFSRKWIVVAGGVLWSLATLMTAVTHSYTTLLIRHTIVGIGEASFGIIAPTIVADMFPEAKRGRILGIFYLALPVGAALGYIVGGAVGGAHGWRAPFYLAGAPGLLLALAIAFLPEVPRGIQDSIPETLERKSFAGLMRNKAFWTATVGMGFMTFALGGISVWMPTFLVRERGYSVGTAGTIFGLILLFDGIVASLLGGWVGDKLLPRYKGAYYLVSAITLGLGIPVMMFALHATGVPMFIGILIAGFLLLFNTSPLNTALINAVGSHIRAFALAVNIVMIHLLGDVPSSWIIGRLADRYPLHIALSSTAVGLALATAVLFYGMRFAPHPESTLAAGTVSE